MRCAWFTKTMCRIAIMLQVVLWYEMSGAIMVQACHTDRVYLQPINEIKFENDWRKQYPGGEGTGEPAVPQETTLPGVTTADKNSTGNNNSTELDDNPTNDSRSGGGTTPKLITTTSTAPPPVRRQGFRRFKRHSLQRRNDDTVGAIKRDAGNGIQKVKREALDSVKSGGGKTTPAHVQPGNTDKPVATIPPVEGVVCSPEEKEVVYLDKDGGNGLYKSSAETMTYKECQNKCKIWTELAHEKHEPECTHFSFYRVMKECRLMNEAKKGYDSYDYSSGKCWFRAKNRATSVTPAGPTTARDNGESTIQDSQTAKSGKKTMQNRHSIMVTLINKNK